MNNLQWLDEILDTLDFNIERFDWKEGGTDYRLNETAKTEAKVAIATKLEQVELEARIDERVKATLELYNQKPKDRQLFNNIGNAYRDRIADLKAHLTQKGDSDDATL